MVVVESHREFGVICYCCRIQLILIGTEMKLISVEVSNLTQRDEVPFTEKQAQEEKMFCPTILFLSVSIQPWVPDKHFPTFSTV
jgi:hypothetical protein